MRCTYQPSLHCKNGDGISQNAGMYYQYLYRVANRGIIQAYVKLAQCYRDGIGTKEDGVQALKWYNETANFSPEGLGGLGQFYSYGIGTDID